MASPSSARYGQSSAQKLEKHLLRHHQLVEQYATAENEVRSLRARHATEIQELHKRYRAELEALQTQLEDQTEQKRRLQGIEQEQHTELLALREQCQDIEEMRVEAARQREELDSKAAELDEAVAALAAANSDLAAARKAKTGMEKEQRRSKSNVRLLEQEVESLKQQVEDTAAARESDIQDMMRQSEASLQGLREEWDAISEERVRQIEAEVKRHNSSTIDDLRAHVTDVTAELRAARDELEVLKDAQDEEQKAKAELLERLTRSEEAHRQEAARWKGDQKTLERALDLARARLLKKEEEFSAVMNDKIAADASLSQFQEIISRSIPEDEEQQQQQAAEAEPPAGGKRGGKKRRGKHHHHPHAASKKKYKRGDVDHQEPVQIAELDLHEDLVVIANRSNEPVSLAGWALASEYGGQTFQFPDDMQVPPGARVQIWSGKRNVDKHDPGSGSFLWTRRYVWNDDGDSAVLMDPAGKVVSRKEVVPQEWSGDEAEDGEGAAGGEGGQCVVS